MYKSYTGKPWAREYAPLQKMSVHTSFDHTGLCHATFDTAFIPLYDNEEEKRGNEPAYPPNTRFWRLESESDIEHWWHAEVSDIVLSAWAQYPRMVETCHAKPLRLVNVPENVDSTYSVYIGNQRSPIAIGEIKRNLINDREWQAGILGAAQQKLASELRGSVSFLSTLTTMLTICQVRGQVRVSPSFLLGWRVSLVAAVPSPDSR